MSVPPPDMPPPAAPYGVGTDTTQDERTMAMLAHLLGIVSGFIGALIIYLIKKDQSRFVANQAMQALCFQVGIAILSVIAYVITLISFGLLGIVAFVPWVLSIIFSIIAGMAANKGEWYSYPVTGNFAIKQVGAL